MSLTPTSRISPATHASHVVPGTAASLVWAHTGTPGEGSHTTDGGCCLGLSSFVMPSENTGSWFISSWVRECMVGEGGAVKAFVDG